MMRRARQWTRWAPALALLALPGCGAGGAAGDPAPAWTAVDGLVGRSCRYVSDPDDMPPFGDVVRIGTRGNIALWGRSMGPADTVQLSIRYADDGRLLWVETIGSTMAPDRAAALEQLVFDALDESYREDWGLRVTVAGGDVSEVAPSVICEPEQASGAGVWANIPTNREALRDFYLVRGRRIPVRVTLDERGRLVDARLVQSTYSRWVDQYVIDFVRNLTFEPKLHDGIGVATTFELQLRFPRR